ncbi:hypothetical protein FBU30_002777, partial [Linnemannia zychae]
NLSPSERQTLASNFSPSPPSSKTTVDPHLSSKPTVQTIEPYKRLEQWLIIFKQYNKFFNFPKTHELKDYANIEQYHHVQHLEYIAPPLISTKD